MRIHKINLLTKLLISYLLVLMFPVIVILCYYYPYSADVVKEKEMDWNAHITEQFMTSMDTFTRYVYNLPFELVQNREFKMYKAEESDYQRVLIANEMKIQCNRCIYLQHLAVCKEHRLFVFQDWKRIQFGRPVHSGRRLLL